MVTNWNGNIRTFRFSFLCSIIWVFKKHPEFWSIFLQGEGPSSWLSKASSGPGEPRAEPKKVQDVMP
jgi:hypothetical protein